MDRARDDKGRWRLPGDRDVASASDGGCRAKPSRKRCSKLAETGTSAVERHDVTTAPAGVRLAMAVFGAHPYNRSSGLGGALCDSLVEEQHSTRAAISCPCKRLRCAAGNCFALSENSAQCRVHKAFGSFVSPCRSIT